MFVCLSACLLICWSSCLSVCLSFCWYVFWSVSMSTCLSGCLSVSMSVCLVACLSVGQTVYLSVCLVSLLVCLSVFLLVYIFVSPFAFGLSVDLFVCLSVCQFFCISIGTSCTSVCLLIVSLSIFLSITSLSLPKFWNHPPPPHHFPPSVSLFIRLSVSVVLDMNDETPTFFPRVYNASVLENVPRDFVVVRLNCSDNDAGLNAELSYFITGQRSKDLSQTLKDCLCLWGGLGCVHTCVWVCMIMYRAIWKIFSTLCVWCWLY